MHETISAIYNVDFTYNGPTTHQNTTSLAIKVIINTNDGKIYKHTAKVFSELATRYNEQNVFVLSKENHMLMVH